MELYGHTAGTTEPLALTEVTLRGSAEVLRTAAFFLAQMADVIEDDPKRRWDYQYLRFRTGPNSEVVRDLIVANPGSRPNF